MIRANLNPSSRLACEQFIYKHEKNKEGQEYSTVRSAKDILFLEDFLPKFCEALKELFHDKNLAKRIFNERILLIDAIRFDDEDKDLMPLKPAYDRILEMNNGELIGGLIMPMYGEGVILLDMDFMKLSKAEAIHTLIHELVHAMTMRLEKDKKGYWYKIGIHEKRNKVFERLNEGITEIIAQKIWAFLYSRKRCPGIGRYNSEVVAAKKIIELFGDEQKFIEDYILNANLIVEEMKCLTDENNQSLYDFLQSFNGNDLREKSTQYKFINSIEKFSIQENILI